MAEPAERFEVRTDRAAIGRRVKRGLQLNFSLVLLAGAAVAGLVVMGITSLDISGPAFGLLAGAVLGLTLVMYSVVWMLTGPTMWIVRREIPMVLIADASGLWIAVPGTADGFVFLPWSAVGAVKVRGGGKGKGLTVGLRPGVRPDHPGAMGLMDPIAYNAARRGVRVNTLGTTADAATVRTVIDQYRAGAGMEARG